MNLDHLYYQVQLTSKALEYNLEGISDEEALKQPGGGGNCINWLVGHIITTRDTYYIQLGRDPVLPESMRNRYVRGSQPISTGDDIYQLSELFKYFQKSNAKFQELLDSMSKKIVTLSNEQIKDLGGILFHDAYHIGQVAIVRRTLGKEGAIK